MQTKEIKRRIRSVSNTQQITKAMAMVASAKLRRSQERAQHSRPYAEQMKQVIADIASGGNVGFQHPLLTAREVKKTGYLVMTSDRGLAGGYNANLLRLLQTRIRKRHSSSEAYAIFVIGRKGQGFLKFRGYPIVKEMIDLTDFPTYANIKDITSNVVQLFQEGAFDALYLYYNHFINPLQQEPREELLLPLTQLLEELRRETGEGQQEQKKYVYEYEPSVEEVLAALLPKYAESLIYASLLDAKASEQAARMTAMNNAKDNAAEIIEELNLSYNRARQAAITQEVSEIVGGANALQS